MELYKETLPCLEINMKKSNCKVLKLFKNIRSHLISPNYTLSQMKAYSFFNKIEERTKDNNNNNPKNLNNFLKLSEYNYKTKKNISFDSNKIFTKKNTIKSKRCLDEIRKKTPISIKFYRNPEIEGFSAEMKRSDKYRHLNSKYNLKLNLFKKEKEKYLRNYFYNDKSFLKFFSPNNKYNINGKYYLLSKYNKKILTPSINEILLSFDKKIKNNSFDLTNKINNRFNNKILVPIEKNLLEKSNEINKSNAEINKGKLIIRLKNAYKTKKINYH
jgi:hypothetical protein